jgi:hypothetical protein
MLKPELLMYVDINFGGLHTHLFGNTPDFTQLALGGAGSGIAGNWNDKVSSFVVQSGRWQFFRDVNYVVPIGPVFGPGIYNWVEAVGVGNDQVSSVKVVGD